MRAEKAEKNYIPPEELEGGRVVEYSQHNKEYVKTEVFPREVGRKITGQKRLDMLAIMMTFI